MIHKSYTKTQHTRAQAYISFRNGCSLTTSCWNRREESAMHKSFIVRLVGRVDLEFVHYDVFL